MELKDIIIEGKIKVISQKYLGTKPRDVGCKNYYEMRDKMANEIITEISNSCDNCIDKGGNNIGNMYVCEKCGRDVN